MNAREDTRLRWRKSSYSGTGNGNCAEVAFAAGRVAVRDSKSPLRGDIGLNTRAWLAFAGTCGASR